MKRVLVTGMSGVGKSTVAWRLAARGFRAIDTDATEYSELVRYDAPDRYGTTEDWLWREDRIAAALDDERGDALFVCGTATNMVKFYPRFDRIVLLTASDAVMVERMRGRTNNPYGHFAGEIERQLALKPLVEPHLRRVANVVIDASRPLDEVVEQVAALAR